ncbi:hypothetical protein ACLKA6_007281 [Drosophila palustris]
MSPRDKRENHLISDHIHIHIQQQLEFQSPTFLALARSPGPGHVLNASSLDCRANKLWEQASVRRLAATRGSSREQEAGGRSKGQVRGHQRWVLSSRVLLNVQRDQHSGQQQQQQALCLIAPVCWMSALRL